MTWALLMSGAPQACHKTDEGFLAATDVCRRIAPDKLDFSVGWSGHEVLVTAPSGADDEAVCKGEVEVEISALPAVAAGCFAHTVGVGVAARTSIYVGRNLTIQGAPFAAVVAQDCWLRVHNLTTPGQDPRYAACNTLGLGAADVYRLEPARDTSLGRDPTGQLVADRAAPYPIFVDHAQRFVVGLPEPPPQAVTCSFDSEHGQSILLEWERGDWHALSRTVILRPANDKATLWRFRCSAANHQLALGRTSSGEMSLGPNVGWVFDNAGFEYVSALDAVSALPLTIVPNPSAPDVRVHATVSLVRHSLLSVGETAGQLASARGGESSARSWAVPVSAEVAEGLSILADIVVERARQGGLSLVRGLLKAVLCENLTLSLDQLQAMGGDGFALRWRRLTRPVSTSDGARYVVLPETCAAVEHLELEDLMAQARVLMRAVGLDALQVAFTLAEAGIDELVDDPDLSAYLAVVVTHLHQTLRGAVEGSQVDLASSAQVLMARLAAEAQAQLTAAKGTPSTRQCLVGLAFAAMSICGSDDGCDARLVQDVLTHPSNYLDYEGCQTAGGLAERAELLRALTGLVHEGVALLRPPVANTPAEDRWRAGVVFAGRFASVLVSDVMQRSNPADFSDLSELARFLKAAQALTCVPESLATQIKACVADPNQCGALGALTATQVASWRVPAGDTCAPAQRSIKRIQSAVRLTALREANDQLVLSKIFAIDGPRAERLFRVIEGASSVADAIADNDTAGAIAAAADLLRQQLPRESTNEAVTDALQRGATILTAIVGYSRSLEKTKPTTVEERAALRDQRREILESAIDALTDRSSRDGNTVLSLGSAAGFVSGARFGGNSGAAAPQLSLPLGIALQGLPGACGKYAGWHLFFYGLDLGQFLAYGDGVDPSAQEDDAPRWNAFLSPGFQAGLLLGTPANAAVLALDLNYAPNIDKAKEPTDSWRIGLMLGYYVPLLDMN